MRATLTVLLIGLLIGLLLLPATGDDKENSWGCSMHPQFRAATKGKCKICGMELIPNAPPYKGRQAVPRLPRLIETRRALALPIASQRALDKLLASYLEIARQLASDRLTPVRKLAATHAEQARLLQLPDISSAKTRRTLHEFLGVIRWFARDLRRARTLAGQRRAFRGLSSVWIELIERAGHSHRTPLYIVHCPMADQIRGASWLQTEMKVRNPFYGQSMLGCGQVKRGLRPLTPKKE